MQEKIYKKIRAYPARMREAGGCMGCTRTNLELVWVIRLGITEVRLCRDCLFRLQDQLPARKGKA